MIKRVDKKLIKQWDISSIKSYKNLNDRVLWFLELFGHKDINIRSKLHCDGENYILGTD